MLTYVSLNLRVDPLCVHFSQIPRISLYFFNILLFFSLIVFGGPQAPFFCIYSPLPPLRGQPMLEYHPRWQPIQGLAVHCRLERLLDSNPGLQVYSLVSLPMSPHCSLYSTTYSFDKKHVLSTWFCALGNLDPC